MASIYLDSVFRREADLAQGKTTERPKGYQHYLFWQISRRQVYWIRLDKSHHLYFHPTIGRTVQHAPAVDTSKITALFSPCRTWRYRLTLPFSKRDGDMVTVFLKNPSSASEAAADKTVRTASEFVWRRFPEAGGVHILNLYAIRGTDSVEVGSMLIERGEAYVIGPENDKTIAQTLAESESAIIAWGGHAGVPAAPYDERIRQCRHVLDQSLAHIFRNGRKGSEKYPFHACYWGYEDELTPVSIPH